MSYGQQYIQEPRPEDNRIKKVAFAVLIVVAVAAIVGFVFWLNRDTSPNSASKAKTASSNKTAASKHTSSTDSSDDGTDVDSNDGSGSLPSASTTSEQAPASQSTDDAQSDAVDPTIV